MHRIAIVEDSADNRLLLRAILGDEFALDEYESGSEGLDGITRSTPDLVLLDISLPGMDGVEVVRRIRADERLGRLPVIALTAHAMTGDREKYLAAGFSDYVSKPIVDEQILLGAIGRWLNQT